MERREGGSVEAEMRFEQGRGLEASHLDDVGLLEHLLYRLEQEIGQSLGFAAWVVLASWLTR